jgi:hypothetical protein
MRRAVAEWTRTVSESIPVRLGTAVLLGAWVSLAALFAVVGNALLLTVVTTTGQSLGPTLAVSAVVGVFAVPAASLVLARRVVASAVHRYEAAVVRTGDPTTDRGHLATCDRDERGVCRTSGCC